MMILQHICLVKFDRVRTRAYARQRANTSAANVSTDIMAPDASVSHLISFFVKISMIK